MGPKAKPAQPRALPHGKKDGPRRTPKHVADPLVAIWDTVSSLLDSFSSFQIFGFSLNSKEFLSNGPYASKIGLSIIKL